MILEHYWFKLLKKIRRKSCKGSKVHPTSKIEAGSEFINSTMGRHSFCGYDCNIINTNIGSFTSIASNVSIGGSMHQIDWVSTSPVFHIEKDSISKKYSKFKKDNIKITTIGHDVWIGEKVLIKAGVTIGIGSVIGMGSVVTKDVSDYEIVGGVPAKLIRKRFSDNIIKRLIKSEWWLLDDERLTTCAKDIRNPKVFLDNLGL